MGPTVILGSQMTTIEAGHVIFADGSIEIIPTLHPLLNKLREVDSGSSAIMMLRREAYLQV